MPSAGRIVLTSGHGGPHDFGKALVAIMLKGAGSDALDLGADAHGDDAANAVERVCALVAAREWSIRPRTAWKSPLERRAPEGEGA